MAPHHMSEKSTHVGIPQYPRWVWHELFQISWWPQRLTLQLNVSTTLYALQVIPQS